jgi:hypothetical protein
MSAKLSKRLFYFFLFLTLYATFVFVVLPFFEHPRIHHFAEYQRLENWDLGGHARGDFDGDGQEDLISLTGCAFLSKAVITEIPAEHQCTAVGIISMLPGSPDDRVGQKYIDFAGTNLDLAAFDKGLPINHSYMGRNNGENWKIYLDSPPGLSAYEIQSNGLLLKVESLPWDHQVDEWLYFFSSFFIFFALPLIPVFFILTPVTEPFRSASSDIPAMEIIILLVIAGVFYLIWQKNLKTK